MICGGVYIIFRQGVVMRKKNISKRRWRARLLMGKWIPGMIIYHYGFDALYAGWLVQHPEMDFYRIAPLL